MNIADRSLALVDLALRRRFAFVDLEPRLGPAWREWLTGRCGLLPDFVGEVELRIAKLNETIADDPTLGRQFRIGHSYVTPRMGKLLLADRGSHSRAVGGRSQDKPTLCGRNYLDRLMLNFWRAGATTLRRASRRFLCARVGELDCAGCWRWV